MSSNVAMQRAAAAIMIKDGAYDEGTVMNARLNARRDAWSNAVQYRLIASMVASASQECSEIAAG